MQTHKQAETPESFQNQSLIGDIKGRPISCWTSSARSQRRILASFLVSHHLCRLPAFCFKPKQHGGKRDGIFTPRRRCAAVHPPHLFQFHTSNASLTLRNVTGMKLFRVSLLRQKGRKGDEYREREGKMLLFSSDSFQLGTLMF